MTRQRASIALLIVAGLFAACGGGGGGGITPGGVPTGAQSGSGSNTSATQTVKFALAIPVSGAAPTPGKVRRDFVSSASNGATVAVTNASGGSVHAVVDLSPTSNACSVSGSVRTCSVTIVVPTGNDTFTVTTYDAAPVNGAIPGGAHELGIGSAVETINASSSALDITISGLIANLGSLPAFSSLPADGAKHQVPIVLAPTDFGNQPIVAGTNDPYANPITVTLAENGGSGHATLLFDGATTGSSSVTLSHSNDTVTLQYDGGGSPGYGFTITASASGVTPSSTSVGPLFIAGSGLTSSTLTLTAPGTPVTLTITEAGAPGATQYSAGASSGCNNIATVSSVTGTGASATFTATGGTQPSQDVCSILISDGTIYYMLAVINSPNGVTPSPTPTASPTPSPTNTPTPASGSGGVTIDGYSFTTQTFNAGGVTPWNILGISDGNMWFNSSTNGAFGYTNAAQGQGYVSTFTVGGGGSADTQSMALASDGNLYFADQYGGDILDVNPSTQQQAVFTAPTTITPTAIASAPDGNIYFADSYNNAIWSLSIAGQFTQYNTGSSYTWMTADTADNALWLVDTTGKVQRFSLASHTITDAGTALTGSAGSATSIAVGSDGNLWVTTTSTKIVKFAPGSPGTQTDYANGTASASQGIAAGVDNAMWYAVPGSNDVVRMALSGGATTVFPLSPSVPWSIGIGHDGSIWFVDQTNAQIGHLAP